MCLREIVTRIKISEIVLTRWSTNDWSKLACKLRVIRTRDIVSELIKANRRREIRWWIIGTINLLRREVWCKIRVEAIVIPDWWLWEVIVPRLREVILPRLRRLREVIVPWLWEAIVPRLRWLWEERLRLIQWQRLVKRISDWSTGYNR